MKWNGIECTPNKPARIQRVKVHAKRVLTVEDYQRELDRAYDQLDMLHDRAEMVGGYTPATDAEIDAIEALIPILDKGLNTAPTSTSWNMQFA